MSVDRRTWPSTGEPPGSEATAADVEARFAEADERRREFLARYLASTRAQREWKRSRSGGSKGGTTNARNWRRRMADGA